MNPVRQLNKISYLLLIRLFFITFLIGSFVPSEILSKEPVPEAFQNSGMDEKIGNTIPLDIPIQHQGENKKLQDFFQDEKPVILVLSYYSCPMLCNLLTTGVRDSLLKYGRFPGDDYSLLSISFDPLDSSETASRFKAKNLANVPDQLYDNWHLLTANQEAIDALTSAVGFQYYFDTSINQYAHIPAIIVITPNGMIARYLYGLTYKPTDIKLAISEAKLEKTRSTVEKILLFCYNYNPDRNSYTLFAINLMKASGIVTIVFIVSLILFLNKKEKKDE